MADKSDLKTVDIHQQLDDMSRELRLIRAHTNALFSSIGDGIVATNKNGRIERINRAALEMLGYKSDEVIGKWFPEIVRAFTLDDQEVTPLDRPITQTFLTKKPITQKLLYARKDGSKFPAAITVSPITIEGIPIGAVETFRDITTDFHMDKMKDDFISIASHQLRTPATGVKQYVGMILEGYAGTMTESQTTMLQKAYESNERQLRIIEDLLRVAKVEAGKITLNKEKVDLYHLVEDIMLELSRTFLHSKQTVSVSANTKPLNAFIDCDRFRMALENIIENASKYTPAGGKIDVLLRQNKRNISIRVVDNGVGIAPEDRQRLFQKFVRLGHRSTHSVNGNGLGLYWAKQIIDLHEGSISVASELGKGSEFCIKVPVHDT